jgi:hypothetical protein
VRAPSEVLHESLPRSLPRRRSRRARRLLERLVRSTEEDPHQTDQSAEELKKKNCVLNGIFPRCPAGEHFDPCAHKCVK